MIEFTGMELNGVARDLVACDCKVKELWEVPLKQGVSCLWHISHLESALQFKQDRHKLLVKLSVFHHVGSESWALEKLDELSHVVAYIGDPVISWVEERVPYAGKVLESLGSLHFNRCWLLVSYLCCQDSEQVLHCWLLLYKWGPRGWNIGRNWVIKSLIQ